MGWKTNAGHEGRSLVPYLSSMFRSSFHPSRKVMVDDVRSPFMGAFEFIMRRFGPRLSRVLFCSIPHTLLDPVGEQ